MANSHETLTSLFTDIANSIRSKTGKSDAIVADNFPSEIDTITAGGNLQEKTVTPTGQQITVAPDEGYDGMSTVIVEGDTNLTSQNIAEGITIYGVEGTLKIGTASEVPSEYQTYVDYAKTLYTGEYANIAILESNDILNVAFLMDDFNVTSYDATSTEFMAIGWLYCEYTKATKTWRVVDHRTEASTGTNYVKHIRYSSANWRYGGNIIWPVGASSLGGGPLPIGVLSVTAIPPTVSIGVVSTFSTMLEPIYVTTFEEVS